MLRAVPSTIFTAASTSLAFRSGFLSSAISRTWAGVTFDVGKAVREVKGGKIEYRVDKAGNLHAPVGKASFGKEQLLANVQTFLREVVRTKPPAAKGQYIRSVTLSSTMGPPVRIDPATVQATFKA